MIALGMVGGKLVQSLPAKNQPIRTMWFCTKKHIAGPCRRSLSAIWLGAALFCATAQADEPPAAQDDAQAAEHPAWPAMPAALADLLQYAVDQDGTPYRRGGATPESGFDCSGFVRHVFAHVEGVVLPHSAKALSMLGEQIKKTELQPGDLVFFRIVRHTVSHVGIYLGNNRFIHASSIRTGGVRISDLADAYWAKRFTAARRLGVAEEQQETPAAE